VLTGTFPPLFRLALLEKDAGIAADLAASLGVDAPTLATVHEAFRVLRASLGDSADYMEPFRVAEAAAGVSLRG
jgi:3-hydroxyisobutyrate dehydrogenase